MPLTPDSKLMRVNADLMDGSKAEYDGGDAAACRNIFLAAESGAGIRSVSIDFQAVTASGETRHLARSFNLAFDTPGTDTSVIADALAWLDEND